MRQKRANETCKEYKIRLAKNAAANRRRRQNETEADRAWRRMRNAMRQRLRRSMETPERKIIRKVEPAYCMCGVQASEMPKLVAGNLHARPRSPVSSQLGTPSSSQSSVDKRITRQKEKRPINGNENNENTPVSSKTIRLERDIIPLNGSSSSVMSPVRSNESISIDSGPSDESLKQRSPRIKAQLKRQYSDDVIKLKSLMEKMDDIDKVKQLAADALQEDINRWQQKLRTLVTEYTRRINDVKHKQWCRSCDHESILHCCWNTSYCSRECQEKDWPTHKRLHKFSKPQ